jgi:hypothetical protein
MANQIKLQGERIAFWTSLAAPWLLFLMGAASQGVI